MVSALLLVLAAAPNAALVERLTAHADRLEALTKNASMTMTVRGEELDGDGKPKSTFERVTRQTVKEGQSSQELLKAVEDGRDVTEERRREQAEKGKKKEEGDQKGRKSVSIGAALPFGKKEVEKYEYALLAPSQANPGLVRIAFKPRGAKSGELMIGDALVDPEKGELVRLSMRPSKNPRFVDHLVIELEFGAITPAGRALSRLDARGDGGFLLIHKWFHVETLFSDFEVEPAK